MNYDKYMSEKAKAIPPSGIRKFFDIAAEMKDCISLGVGEPDFITPKKFSQAGIDSILAGKTQYTSNNGLLELRRAIAKYLKDTTGNTYDPVNEILVTVGASEAIDLGLRVLLNPGDEVIIPSPSYVSYAPCVSLCHGVPVPIDCKVENNFKLLPEEIEAVVTPKTKAIILPYPNNPTGAIMEKKYLEAIAPVIIKHDLIVLSDEIYSELTYDGEHYSITSVPGMFERTILMNGFSKAFAMTGWRIGYLAAPKELALNIRKIHQYAIMCAPTASQYAALSALETSFKNGFAEVKEMREKYNERRVFLVNRLNKMGLNCFEPKGAFYVFPCVKVKTGMNGQEFAETLLRKKSVAVVPGRAFGSSGEDFVRISYAYSLEKLKLAMDKIEEFLNGLK